MQFVLLIYFDESEVMERSPEERLRVLKQCAEHNRDLDRRGFYVSGAPLAPSFTAATVQTADSEQLFSDGPFAETKEQLAGYYLLECADRDEAVRIAEEIIDAQENFRGAVEIHEAIGVTGQCISCF
jgi:hypothetical protein